MGVSLFEYSLPMLHFDELRELHLPIGKQIEHVLLKRLEADKLFDVIAYGLQISQNGITLGELDFILRDKSSDTFLHVELVHKFYLLEPSFSRESPQAWLGPGRKDRLDLKLDKLSTHQFPLLNHPETQKTLVNLGLEGVDIEQALCFHGQLYLPAGEAWHSGDFLSDKAWSGNYLSRNLFLAKLDLSASYHLCDKMDWIRDASTLQNWISPQELINKLTNLEHPERSHMVWRKKGNHIHKMFLNP